MSIQHEGRAKLMPFLPTQEDIERQISAWEAYTRVGREPILSEHRIKRLAQHMYGNLSMIQESKEREKCAWQCSTCGAEAVRRHELKHTDDCALGAALARVGEDTSNV